MRKIKNCKIGEYVLATKYSDKDPCDPWIVGRIVEFGTWLNNERFYVIEGETRRYRNIFRITKEEGRGWVSMYLTD